ncbi:hypothetical protein LTR78_006949 [Recurvomyces mirabilis]|uniref:Uncharacterized protein n=1 Tax=Recurvomyces mirabilis TaxID=574656 RepID=A0AAE0WJZ0_9PEZI|nr:hypothetical protein LTR78_006949 [Recurvomyces mirabilis]KAK5153333.1 hypothetical protein LTS14_007502 [Recurvomyces mirabilis]
MSSPRRTPFDNNSHDLHGRDISSAFHTDPYSTIDNSIGEDPSTIDESKPVYLKDICATASGSIASAVTPSPIDSGFVSPSALTHPAHRDWHGFYDHMPLRPTLWRAGQLRDLLAAQKLPYSPTAPDSPTPSTCDTASDCGMPEFEDDLPVGCRLSDIVDRRALIDCGDGYCLHESICVDRHHTPSSHVVTPRRFRSADPWLQTPRLPRPAPDPTTEHEDLADQLLQQLDDLQGLLQQTTVGTIGALLNEQDALYDVLRHTEARDALADAYVAATVPLPDADETTALQEDRFIDSEAIDKGSDHDWEVLDTSLPSVENGRTWKQWLWVYNYLCSKYKILITRNKCLHDGSEVAGLEVEEDISSASSYAYLLTVRAIRLC